MLIRKQMLKTLFISDFELVEVRDLHSVKQFYIRAHRNNQSLDIIIDCEIKTKNLSLYLVLENGYVDKLEENSEICKLLLNKTKLLLEKAA